MPVVLVLVVLATAGMRSAQSFGECGGGENHEGYYTAIADMLRAVDSCTIEKAGVVPANNACEFEEQAWPLKCVYPWEIRPNETRWVSPPPTYLGSFKPGQMLLFRSRVRRFSNDQPLRSAMLADIASFERRRVLVDGVVVPSGTYLLGCRTFDGDGLSLSLAARFYLPPGSHHAVVLATNLDSAPEQPGLVRFASFWFDVEPNDNSELDFRAYALGVDAQAENGELHEPTESLRYGHRDFRFVTCCSRFGSVFFHTADERVPEISWITEWRPIIANISEDARMTWYENGAIDDVPIQRKVGSLYNESKCRYVWADAVLVSEAYFIGG